MCGKCDASAGKGSKGGEQHKPTSRTWPPKQLTVAQVNQALGAHMRLARIRMGYSVRELSQLSGVSIGEVESFELGASEDLPVINSVRIGFILRDALGPMRWDAELFCGYADLAITSSQAEPAGTIKKSH